MDSLRFYNPYTYQPKVAGFFMGRPFPSELSKVAAQNPEAANHIMSIWQFGEWLNQTQPALYSAIKARNPALLDAGTVVLQGRLNAPVFYADPPKPPASIGGAAGKTQMAGLRGDAASTASPDVITEWGKNVSDLLGKYLVYDQQKKLIDLNIKRAEQGLPPVSSEQLAAGVNIGLADSTQRLAYLALGGLVLVGLFSAFKGRRA